MNNDQDWFTSGHLQNLDVMVEGRLSHLFLQSEWLWPRQWQAVSGSFRVWHRNVNRAGLRLRFLRCGSYPSVMLLFGPFQETANNCPLTSDCPRSWWIFFALTLLLAWIMAFQQGDKNFSATSHLSSMWAKNLMAYRYKKKRRLKETVKSF